MGPWLWKDKEKPRVPQKRLPRETLSTGSPDPELLEDFPVAVLSTTRQA